MEEILADLALLTKLNLKFNSTILNSAIFKILGQPANLAYINYPPNLTDIDYPLN